jgi:CTP:molybdopterin cytidylyltransferase MocA
MLAAIILAGGESHRMGKPKALLELHGRTFLENLLEVTRHPRVECQRVVLGAAAEEILARVELPDDVAVVNADWRRGQLSSLQAGLRSLPAGTEGTIVCPVDHPLVSAALVASLIAAFDTSASAITLPVYKERRGHPVIFRATLYEELLTTDVVFGARSVVRAHRDGTVEVPTDEEGVVLNLNDPEVWRKALRRL